MKEGMTNSDVLEGLQSMLSNGDEDVVKVVLGIILSGIEGHMAGCVILTLLATWETGGLPVLHDTIHGFMEEYKVMDQFNGWMTEQIEEMQEARKIDPELDAMMTKLERANKGLEFNLDDFEDLEDLSNLHNN